MYILQRIDLKGEKSYLLEMRNTPHYYEFLVEKEKQLARSLGWSSKITFLAILFFMGVLFFLIIKWIS